MNRALAATRLVYAVKRLTRRIHYALHRFQDPLRGINQHAERASVPLDSQTGGMRRESLVSHSMRLRT